MQKLDLSFRVLFHWFQIQQIVFDRILLTFSDAKQLFPRITSQSLGDRVREHKIKLNNITLERTIEYNTTQPQNSTAKEFNATSEIKSTLKKGPKSTLPAHIFVTCLSYRTSLLAVTIVSNNAVTQLITMPWHAPAKIKRGGHFCVLTGMWVFQSITLHRETNSA